MGLARISRRPSAAATLLSFCILALAAGAPAQTPVAHNIADSVEQLKRLRADLETKREVAKNLGGREQSVLDEIRELEESLGLTRKILRGLHRQEEVLAAELSLAHAALDESGRRLKMRKDELAKALRRLYKHGRYHSLEILLSSRSFPNLLERFRFLGSVAVRNRQILHQIEIEQTRYDETCRTLVRRSRDLEELREEREGEEGRIEADVGRRTRILGDVRSEKSKYDHMVLDLERSARELETLIARMEEARARAAAAPGADFGSRKGGLPPPVEGEVAVTFGKHRHPQFGTVTISNGVDYRARLGAPVKAVAPGLVEHVSWLTGYGQCVILSHGNGYYTLYAHCGEVMVEVGQSVSEGMTVASVGDTGSLIGPALHFEIRQGREALNPADWVRSR
ncbi:MAG: peptidoglycan DD-metalloendopeptidase family protein [Candidatus Eisenbacteria sp.]|nr:peptidoglycan DD-metalloendopeptidase family protein [Candidatus Eisenbacteria bacterium]